MAVKRTRKLPILGIEPGNPTEAKKWLAELCQQIETHLAECAPRETTVFFERGPWFVNAVKAIEALNYYRAIFESGTQNRTLAANKLKVPVLAIAGALWLGDAMHGAIGPLADKFEMLSILDCAHFPPEETPTEVATALRQHFARCL